MVGPVSLTTTPVPFRKKRARHERHLFQANDRRASACGSETVVTLRLRSCVSAPALHFPVRRIAGRSKILSNATAIICSWPVYLHSEHNFYTRGGKFNLI